MTEDEIDEATEAFGNMLEKMRAPDTFTYYRESAKPCSV